MFAIRPKGHYPVNSLIYPIRIAWNSPLAEFPVDLVLADDLKQAWLAYRHLCRTTNLDLGLFDEGGVLVERRRGEMWYECD